MLFFNADLGAILLLFLSTPTRAVLVNSFRIYSGAHCEHFVSQQDIAASGACEDYSYERGSTRMTCGLVETWSSLGCRGVPQQRVDSRNTCTSMGADKKMSYNIACVEMQSPIRLRFHYGGCSERESFRPELQIVLELNKCTETTPNPFEPEVRESYRVVQQRKSGAYVVSYFPNTDDCTGNKGQFLPAVKNGQCSEDKSLSRWNAVFVQRIEETATM